MATRQNAILVPRHNADRARVKPAVEAEFDCLPALRTDLRDDRLLFLPTRRVGKLRFDLLARCALFLRSKT